MGSCSATCQQDGQQNTCKSYDQVQFCLLLINTMWSTYSANEWSGASDILMSKSWVIFNSSCKNYALILPLCSVDSCKLLLFILRSSGHKLKLEKLFYALFPFKGHFNHSNPWASLTGAVSQALCGGRKGGGTKNQLSTSVDVFMHALSIDR